MKLAFDIVPYKLPTRRAGLYTVHLVGESVSELDRFLSHPESQANEDFERLVRYLSNVPKQGFREGRRPESARFRDEDDIQALSVAHPDERLTFPPSLRLFCLRYGDVVILGSGGVKRERTLLDFRKRNAEANRAVEIMKQVRVRFEDRLDLRDLWIDRTYLLGNLHFASDDIP